MWPEIESNISDPLSGPGLAVRKTISSFNPGLTLFQRDRTTFISLWLTPDYFTLANGKMILLFKGGAPVCERVSVVGTFCSVSDLFPCIWNNMLRCHMTLLVLLISENVGQG